MRRQGAHLGSRIRYLSQRLDFAEHVAFLFIGMSFGTGVYMSKLSNTSKLRMHLNGPLAFRRVMLALLAILSWVFSGQLAQAAELEMVVPGQYIIQRKPGKSGDRSLANQGSYSTLKAGSFIDVVVPGSFRSQSSTASKSEPLNWSKVAEDCAEIMKDPTIETCEPNVLVKIQAVPNDTLFTSQWGLRDTSANDADIRAATAWDRGTGSKSTLIGVIDTGVYYEHPDLSPNLWSNPGEPADGIDNDGNGYVDDFFGVNTVAQTNNPNDCGGHGTHVSGIIAASGNNGIGVSGVNWTASLIVVSASSDCQSGSFSFDAIISGYEYFYNLKRLGHNIRVVNASLGGYVYSAAMYNAIARLNSVDILFVAAAGNDRINNDVKPVYPANYDLPNIISVGAVGPTLEKASYSNYGLSVDIAAPGGDVVRFGSAGGILSTYSRPAAGGLFYESIDGTSMAAPMVTGAIGLIASQRPYLNGAHLKSILFATADSFSSLSGYVSGGRYLNLGAMSLAADPTDNCPSDPNKLEPGICGCGTEDLYKDVDDDGAYDCQDACPNDSLKTSVGACGCGVADSDTDGDGTADCNDQCPADPAKVTAGTCGCGVSDSDGNANGIVDCQDPVLDGIVPPTPKVKAGKKSITVSMTALAGVKYFIRVAETPKGKKKAKIKTYIGAASSGVINKLSSGSTVSVSYAYMLEGTPVRYSYYSRAKSAKIK